MTATYEEAHDAMFAMLNTGWEQGAADIVGKACAPKIFWPGREEPAKAPVADYWCRVSTRSVPTKQSTMKTGIAPDENQRYTSKGLLFVQLFCPMTDAKAYEKGRRLAELVERIYRGRESADNVWFRDVTIDNLPPEADAYRFNISAVYEYDSIA